MTDCLLVRANNHLSRTSGQVLFRTLISQIHYRLMSVAVCVKYMGKFIDSLDSETKDDPKSIEKAITKFCKTSQKDNNRFVCI